MTEIQKQYFQEILKKYNAGKASAEEISFLESYYRLYEVNEELQMDSEQELVIKDKIKLQVDQKIALHEKAIRQRRFSYTFQQYGVAAAVLLMLSVGSYFLLKKPDSTAQLFIAGRHLAPGGNNATLTLADGSKIALTGSSNGHLATQAGIRISKTKDGQLVYTVEKTNSSESTLVFNTLEIPKGGQYQLVLPDGTKVWLNAASSLRFPAAFSATVREVQLEGEAYFEVAKNPERPFRVMSRGQAVEVLGTHFNINSYQDEPGIKTTLLEGSVRVINDGLTSVAVLKPRQQANLSPGGQLKVSNVDPDQFIAWKNGKFIFTDANIKSIMRQVSRWYNVDIEYRGEITKEKFGGRTSRFTNVAQLLEILQLTDQVHFEVQGRRIIVMP